MMTLYPFQSSAESIHLSGGLRIHDGLMQLTFELHDPDRAVLDSLTVAQAQTWARADDLWKTTCFECFLAVPGERGYWEFNLSPHSERWALYRFDDYRNPQPPAPSYDFELQNVRVTETSLNAEWKVKLNLPKLEAGLTAVIRTAGETLYFALEHCRDKPDFHWRDGFVLKL